MFPWKFHGKILILGMRKNLPKFGIYWTPYFYLLILEFFHEIFRETYIHEELSSYQKSGTFSKSFQFSIFFSGNCIMFETVATLSTHQKIETSLTLHQYCEIMQHFPSSQSTILVSQNLKLLTLNVIIFENQGQFWTQLKISDFSNPFPIDSRVAQNRLI